MISAQRRSLRNVISKSRVMTASEMKEYITNAVINGEDKRILILHPMEGLYKVYWDALYLGMITAEVHEEFGSYWDTDSSLLRGCCQDIGEYIESCDD
jgi:hypothetical protein